MATNPYIYDPSQSIRGEFQKAAQGIEQGFALSAQRKMQGYEYVKKQLDDIALIREDLQAENEQYINEYADEQLKATQEALIANGGDLDYKQLGKIQKDIQRINRAKQQSNITIGQADEYAKMIEKNAADLYDAKATYDEIMAIARNKELLFSPKEAAAEMQKIYSKGIDINKKLAKDMFANGTKAITPTLITAADGSRYQIEGELPRGVVLDKNGQVQIENPKTFKEMIRNGEILSEQEMATWVDQNIKNVAGIENRFEDMFISAYLDMADSKLKTSNLKSQEEVERQKYQAAKAKTDSEIAAKKLENFDKEYDLEKKRVENQGLSASAAYTNAQTSASRLGLSEDQFRLSMMDKGWVFEEDKEPYYDKEKDNTLKRAGRKSSSSSFSDILKSTQVDTTKKTIDGF